MLISRRNRWGAAAIAVALGAGAALVSAPLAASAHTPTVSATCSTLTVSATQYETKPAEAAKFEEQPNPDYVAPTYTPGYWEHVPAAYTPAVGSPTIVVTNPDYRPAVPEVPEVAHLEVEWKWWGIAQHGRTTWTAGEYPTIRPNAAPGEWRLNGNTRPVVEQEHVPAQPAIGTPTIEVPNPAYVAPTYVAAHKVWIGPAYTPPVGKPTISVEVAPATAEDVAPNTVDVVIDGETVASESFGSSYAGEFAFPSQYEAASYVVTVTAWNDPDGERGWTRTFEGVSEPCPLPELPEETRVPGEWSAPLLDCESEAGDEVRISRNVTVTTWTHGDDGQPVEHVEEFLEFDIHIVTADEVEALDCPTVPPVSDPRPVVTPVVEQPAPVLAAPSAADVTPKAGSLPVTGPADEAATNLALLWAMIAAAFGALLASASAVASRIQRRRAIASARQQ